MKAFAFFYFLFYSSFIFAIDWDKCRQLGPGGVGAVTSSTQFTSSWGECSAFAIRSNEQRKLFFAQNLEFIQRDIARGNGEYLDAYALLLNCNDNTRKFLPEILQKNYTHVWKEDIEEKILVYFLRLDEILNTDPIVRKNCKLKES